MADTFPQLSRGPTTDYAEEGAGDNIIRSEFEAGPPLSRKRFTKILRKHQIMYYDMTDEDHDLLQAFEEYIGGASFYWHRDAQNRTFEMILAKPIQYSLLYNQPNHWQFDLEFQEV